MHLLTSKHKIPIQPQYQLLLSKTKTLLHKLKNIIVCTLIEVRNYYKYKLTSKSSIDETASIMPTIYHGTKMELVTVCDRSVRLTIEINRSLCVILIFSIKTPIPHDFIIAQIWLLSFPHKFQSNFEL